MKRLLPIFLLAGCTTVNMPPSQRQSQTSKQEQTQTNEQSQAQDAAQTSSHASESKQGTNSMPVIIICNSNNSPRATCATPREGGALNDVVDSNLRSKTK